MLRILSGLLFLIISQVSFATITTSPQIVPATATVNNSALFVNGPGGTQVWVSSSDAAAQYVCVTLKGVKYYWYGGTTIMCSPYVDHSGAFLGGYIYTGIQTTYSCSSGTLSDSSGNASSSGQFCTSQVTIDSCAQYKDQVSQTWVPFPSTSSSYCQSGCVVNVGLVSVATGNNVWSITNGTYTGVSCVNEPNAGNSAQATADNAAAQAAADAAALQAAKDACHYGYVIDNYATGPASVVCNVDPATVTPTTSSATGTTSGATTTDPCNTGYNTGTVNGQTVSVGATGCSGSTNTTPTDTTSSATNTSGQGSTVGDVGNTTGSQTSSITSGASPSTTGGGSTSTTSSATPTATTSGAAPTSSAVPTTVTNPTSAADGTGFTAPGDGKDYLSSVFNADSIAQLKTDQTNIQNDIMQKMNDVKGIFNFSSVAMDGGSLAENKQHMYGSDIDLSGKSIFDKLSIVAAVIWLCAVLTGIKIILNK